MIKADQNIKNLHKEFAKVTEKLDVYLQLHHSQKETGKTVFAITDLFMVDEETGSISLHGAVIEDNQCTLLSDASLKVCPLIFCEREIDGVQVGIEGRPRICDMVEALDASTVWSYERVNIGSNVGFRFYPEIDSYPITDDLGSTLDFALIGSPCEEKVPASILDRVYAFTINRDISKYSKESHVACIIYVDKAWDEYIEEKNIRIARWFPAKKFLGDIIPSSHDRIYEYGDIDGGNEGFEELYEFLTGDEACFLFGHIDAKRHLKIIGGVEQFIDGNLTGCVLPKWLINRI